MFQKLRDSLLHRPGMKTQKELPEPFLEVDTLNADIIMLSAELEFSQFRTAISIAQQYYDGDLTEDLERIDYTANRQRQREIIQVVRGGLWAAGYSETIARAFTGPAHLRRHVFLISEGPFGYCGNIPTQDPLSEHISALTSESGTPLSVRDFQLLTELYAAQCRTVDVLAGATL